MDNTNNHLANERTFLAWIRTSLSIIVFGFVVAKFGIALREFLMLQHHTVMHHVATGSNDSLSIGIAFMSVGTIIGLISLVQYRVIMHRIDANRFKPTSGLITLLGVFTAIFGAVLVIYLILTAQSL